jgi:hypothetical protein
MRSPLRACSLVLLVATAGSALPVIALAQGAPNGRYECWYFTSPRALYNFALPGGGVYIDSEGKRGSVTMSGTQMMFREGALDGQRAIYVGGNPPTVSFRDAQGAERFLCQRAG